MLHVVVLAKIGALAAKELWTTAWHDKLAEEAKEVDIQAVGGGKVAETGEQDDAGSPPSCSETVVRLSR